jgi:hypothetical protein
VLLRPGGLETWKASPSCTPIDNGKVACPFFLFHGIKIVNVKEFLKARKKPN